MAKKNFKSGLDSLLSSSGITKKSKEENTEKKEKVIKEPANDEKHWLLLKIDSLNEELKLWRTGQLTVEKFQKSLKDINFSYNPETNKIE